MFASRKRARDEDDDEMVELEHEHKLPVGCPYAIRLPVLMNIPEVLQPALPHLTNHQTYPHPVSITTKQACPHIHTDHDTA